MNIDGLLGSLTPDIYEKLRQCVETGKWLDGKPLDENQKSMCLQAVMLYQAKIEQSNEHMTLDAQGNIIHKSKRELRDELKSTSNKRSESFNNQTIAKFKENDF